MSLAIDVVGKKITTVEGIGTPENLSPVQAAFGENDAMMCGYCTDGFVTSITGLLKANPDPTEQEVRERHARGISAGAARIRGFSRRRWKPPRRNRNLNMATTEPIIARWHCLRRRRRPNRLRRRRFRGDRTSKHRLLNTRLPRSGFSVQNDRHGGLFLRCEGSGNAAWPHSAIAVRACESYVIGFEAAAWRFPA